MVIQILKSWNPWWAGESKTLKLLRGVVRDSYEELTDSIEIEEITIITGVRRSGKSTLMYQMVDKLLKKGVPSEQILMVNLEDKKLAKTSLEEIYEAYRQGINPDKKAFIFLDEIHRRADWEAWIRKMYDLKTKNKFVISGSCSYLLKKEYSTLLTGRNLTFEVFPLSFKEFLEFDGLKIDNNKLKRNLITDETKNKIFHLLANYLGQGGFPKVFFEKKGFKTKLLAQYFDDILYKDIIDRYDLTSQKTKELAEYLTTNFTSSVSLRNLRNSLGLSYDTIKDNMSYYKEAFLFFTLDHFSYSFKEQKTFPSKIYCIDNGLRNAVAFKFSKDLGKLAENLVAIELKRRAKCPYYWKNNSEVDFIIKEKDQSLDAINVTYTDEIPEREIKGLLKFKKLFKDNAKIHLTLITKDTEKREGGINYVPLWKWLLI